MVKVLFIAYYFPPAGGAGVQRAQKFAQYLPAQGFLPVVLTGPVMRDGRWVPEDATLLSGISADVPVYRAEGPVDHGGRVKRRLENLLALPGSFSEWWIRSSTKAAGRISEKVDLIFATMSPFASCEVAIRLSKSLNVPWVADLRDPWALDEMQVYPTRLHQKLDMRRMGRVLGTAAAIIMNTPDASNALLSAFPAIRKEKVRTITNGFDREDFAVPLEPRNDMKFRIVHSGYLHTEEGFRRQGQLLHRLLGGTASGVDVLTRSHVYLLQAVERWQSERPEIRKDLEIVFVGETSPEDRAVAERSKVASMIQFTGYQRHIESVTTVRTADLLFLPMHNLAPGKRSTIVPGKTYEYMATGQLILAAVPEGDAKDFLQGCGTALTCNPNDVAGMIQILDKVYNAWRKEIPIGSTNKAFVNQFERHNLTHSLATVFNSVLGNNPVRAVPANYEHKIDMRSIQ